jgi:hypothetical protein
MLLVHTFIRKVHIVPRAIPDLIHYTLSLENRKKGGGHKKFFRDLCQFWLIHHQDCTTLIVELPLTLKDNALISENVPVSEGINGEIRA